MDFVCFILFIVLFFEMIPRVRFFIKRIVCLIKITRICHKKKYKLHKTHPLWFLGRKNRRWCDCYIETPKEIFSIKFFSTKRRLNILILKENREYFIRRLLVLSWIVYFAWFKFDGNVKKLPDYDFRYQYRAEWINKTTRNVLLVNPVPMEIRHRASDGQERIVSAGDPACDMEIMNVSYLVNNLKTP